jgi:hypothetical protein
VQESRDDAAAVIVAVILMIAIDTPHPTMQPSSSRSGVPSEESDMAKKTANSTEQRQRIEALKQRAAQLAAGDMPHWESDEMDDDLAEAFWQSVVDVENAPETTNFRQLEEAGVELPSPDSLDDEQLTKKLWEVIETLARLRVFLECTDHLSDRELYARLWHEVLREPTTAMPPSPLAAEHVPLVGLGTDEDARLYLKFYADERTRGFWLEDHPAYDMPPIEEPPYDRDSRMPQP